MPDKNPKTPAAPAKEIFFKCKFCGETKPFIELVVLDQYFPKISVCQECAKGTREET